MSLSQRFPFRDVTSEYFLAILSLHRRCASMKQSALFSFYPRNDRVKNIVCILNGSAGFVSGHDRMSRSGTFARDRRVRSLKNPMRRALFRAAFARLIVLKYIFHCSQVFPGRIFHSLASLSTEVPILSCSGLTKRYSARSEDREDRASKDPDDPPLFTHLSAHERTGS